MRTPLALLALVLSPAAALAATTNQVPKETEVEPKGHYRTAEHVSWFGDVTSMRDIHISDDVGKPGDLCLINPAADYVLRANKIQGRVSGPEVEAVPASNSLTPKEGKPHKVVLNPGDKTVAEKYYYLLWHAASGVAHRHYQQQGSYISLCGLARAVAPGEIKPLQDDYIKTCTRNSWPSDDDARLYTSKGNRMASVIPAIREPLNALIASTHDETAIGAMKATYAFSFRYHFGTPIKKIVEDATRDEKIRIQAIEALALNTPTAMTGQVLAAIWQDEKNSLALRLAAMKAFAFVISYGDFHTKTGNAKYLLPTGDPLQTAAPKGTAPAKAPKFMSEALASYLKGPFGLIAINADENDQAGDPSKLSELGRLAYCAAISYDKGVRDEALGRKKLTGTDKDLPGKPK